MNKTAGRVGENEAHVIADGDNGETNIGVSNIESLIGATFQIWKQAALAVSRIFEKKCEL